MKDFQIANIRVSVTVPVESLKSLALKKFRIKEEEVELFRILRSSVDARKKNDVVYDYRVRVVLKSARPDLCGHPDVTPYSPPAPMTYGEWRFPEPPIIVGFGPAGMFAALYLARCGAKPIVIERGGKVEDRRHDVDNFLKTRILNPNSNIQFGEGGAGTFSDGKLTTNLHNEWIGFVLEEFYKHGATEDVTYAANPHVGTDYLEKVVHNIREEIISLGGTFHFNTCFLNYEKNRQNSLKVECSNNLVFNTKHLLLCIGHSARDTIRHLYEKGVAMEAKAFSIGVRVEHLQRKINTMQYGRFAQYLPAASYKAAVHLPDGRGVYTFCMCPGGTVMASASENETIVTNGMSEKSRSGKNANSALLVGVEPADFYKDSPLDGLAFQEQFERKAFEVSRDYHAPANLMKEFLQGTVATAVRSVKPSYPHGICFCDLSRCLPDYVIRSLRGAIPLIDRRLKGFNDADAVLTGVETRSSSPVRILRNELRESSIAGIYPVGEGAGYAGGITSAAIDGLRTAMEIVRSEPRFDQL
ncbi:MAG: hypothetical protein IJP72_00225 [Bacteroidales bacterium]|nr:hypothetical protein [Bacteroidales bacterium]